MPRTSKPWYRKDRKAWFVTIDGKRHNLGPNRKHALQQFHELMSQPQKRVIPSDSLLAIIDAFLEWCEKHRALDTYEWYRFRLERFAQTYPDLRIGELRPYHVQEWIDDMELSNGSRRNYGRSIKRCVRWAKRQGYIDHNPIADMELPKGGKREMVVSEGEWATILDLVGHGCLRDLLIVTWETGCRPQESLIVEARHIDVQHQRWVFPESESKTDIPRVVYLTRHFQVERKIDQGMSSLGATRSRERIRRAGHRVPIVAVCRQGRDWTMLPLASRIRRQRTRGLAR